MTAYRPWTVDRRGRVLQSCSAPPE